MCRLPAFFYGHNCLCMQDCNQQVCLPHRFLSWHLQIAWALYSLGHNSLWFGCRESASGQAKLRRLWLQKQENWCWEQDFFWELLLFADLSVFNSDEPPFFTSAFHHIFISLPGACMKYSVPSVLEWFLEFRLRYCLSRQLVNSLRVVCTFFQCPGVETWMLLSERSVKWCRHPYSYIVSKLDKGKYEHQACWCDKEIRRQDNVTAQTHRLRDVSTNLTIKFK